MDSQRCDASQFHMHDLYKRRVGLCPNDACVGLGWALSIQVTDFRLGWAPSTHEKGVGLDLVDESERFGWAGPC